MIRIFLVAAGMVAYTSPFSYVYSEPLSLTLHSESAILINADTGAILFEKNAEKEQFPASITKAATALWALKQKGHSLDEEVTVSGESVASVTEEAKRRSNYTLSSWLLVPGATHAGLKKGEIMPFKDLLYCMMVNSAGDASNVIAEFTSGTIPQFVEGMNKYVASLGCKNTHFENPHGLYHPDQKTTAYDMALIMKEAVKDPFFIKLISVQTYSRPKTNKQPAIPYVQNNRLIRPGPFYYPKAIGGKTGYIALAQNTFVVAAEDQGRRLIAVLLKAVGRDNLWKDSIKLFEAAFNQPKIEKVYQHAGKEFSIKADHFEQPLLAYLKQPSKLSFYPAEEPSIKGLLYWDDLTPPIKSGAKVGELRLVEGNKVHSINPLFAKNDINGSYLYQVKHYFDDKTMPQILVRVLLALFTLAGITWFITKKR